MHLLYNKTVEINIFQFQSQKQPWLICCPFTKSTNDSFLPSNSCGISNNFLNFSGSVCTKSPWNLDPHALYFRGCERRHIVVNYVCHIDCKYSLIHKETSRIACEPCLCTGLDPEVKPIMFYSVIIHSLKNRCCSVAQWDNEMVQIQ